MTSDTFGQVSDIIGLGKTWPYPKGLGTLAVNPQVPGLSPGREPQVPDFKRLYLGVPPTFCRARSGLRFAGALEREQPTAAVPESPRCRPARPRTG